jgi:hypothetical protein
VGRRAQLVRRVRLGDGIFSAAWNNLTQAPVLTVPPLLGPKPIGYTGIQVADPATIAMIYQAAANNGYTQPQVDNLIASGGDALAITAAVTKTPGWPGPAALQAQLDTINEMTGGAPPGPPGPPAPSGSSWFSDDALGLGLDNGTYLLIGGAALALFYFGGNR